MTLFGLDIGDHFTSPNKNDIVQDHIIDSDAKTLPTTLRIPPFAPPCSLLPDRVHDPEAWAEVFPVEFGGIGIALRGLYDPSVLEPLGIVGVQHKECDGKSAIFIPGVDCNRQKAVAEPFGREAADFCVGPSVTIILPEECAAGRWGPHACSRAYERLAETCLWEKRDATKQKCIALLDGIRQRIPVKSAR